jgi:hypothetical protein
MRRLIAIPAVAAFVTISVGASGDADAQRRLMTSAAKQNAGSSTSRVRTTSRANVYYRNCAAARAAGTAPVYRGEPGYPPHLDRDHDGVGCE